MKKICIMQKRFQMKMKSQIRFSALLIFTSLFFAQESHPYNGYEYELDGNVYVGITSKDYIVSQKLKKDGDVDALLSMVLQKRIRIFKTPSDAEVVQTEGDMVEIKLPLQANTYWTEARFLRRVPKDEIDYE